MLRPSRLNIETDRIGVAFLGAGALETSKVPTKSLSIYLVGGISVVFVCLFNNIAERSGVPSLAQGLRQER